MCADATAELRPRALAWASDIDVLPRDRVVRRIGDHLVVRSPGNPDHYWGNLLIFDEPPRAGDSARWSAAFAAAFADDPHVRHRTFAWDRTDGALGSAREEFLGAGYGLEETVALVVAAEDLRSHPRENRAVRILALNPASGADAALWEQVIELQVAARDERFAEDAHRAFLRARSQELRALLLAGRGAWYVALEGTGEEVVGSCGVVVTGTRGRFQMVDTAHAHRRRGILLAAGSRGRADERRAAPGHLRRPRIPRARPVRVARLQARGAGGRRVPATAPRALKEDQPGAASGSPIA